MKPVNQKYMDALKSMKEDDFTRDILKPLFLAMGYDRVDFNGGSYERGRDLIAQRRIPPSKEMYMAYIQSKKISDIQNTEECVKFSKLLHQLRQCCSGELVNPDGEKIKPSEVYLACPEQMSNRMIEEIGTQLTGIPIKVKVYDGPAIISDIKEFSPRLLSLLTNVEDKLKISDEDDLINKELLSALKRSDEQEFGDFYSDLSFFVGSFDSNLLFHLDVEVRNDFIEVDKGEWKKAKNEIAELSENYGIYILAESTDEHEKVFGDKKARHESRKNKRLIRIISEFQSFIDDSTSLIREKINTLSISLKDNDSSYSKKKLAPEEVRKRNDVIEELRGSVLGGGLSLDCDMDESFRKEVEDILSIARDRNKRIRDVSKAELKVVGKPKYRLEVVSDILKDRFVQFRYDYYKGIEQINAHKMAAPDVKYFLREAQKTLSLASKFVDNDSILNKLFRTTINHEHEDRVSISPHDIFATGNDVAVYGGAGVGKTTTLQAYAKKESKSGGNLIYVALNRMVDDYKKHKESVDNQEELQKDLLIKVILLGKGIEPTQEHIEEGRRILSGNITLVLDGLDEVYNVINGIIEAISEFKKENESTQLVVSSRDCVSYLRDIEFLGITLLPFTEKQLSKFIYGWINDDDKAAQLIKSIDARGLYEHIKTPLLATITCSLVSKGVDAPSTENEIYSERMRLLTGEYDLHKNITRQKQKGDILRKCARKIAFSMHVQHVRSMSKEEMFSVLVDGMSDGFSRQLLASCLDELNNPCDVLKFDPVRNVYTFGHFRFQEHLASEELKSNRSASIADLIVNDWWNGALCLYAQDNDISHLFEDVYNRFGSIKRAKVILKAMIDNSSKSKRNDLYELFEQYDKSDRYDEMIPDDYMQYENDWVY